VYVCTTLVIIDPCTTIIPNYIAALLHASSKRSIAHRIKSSERDDTLLRDLSAYHITLDYITLDCTALHYFNISNHAQDLLRL
jgi:hypothetical protein